MHDILNLVKDYDYRYLTPYPSIVGTFNEAGYQTVFILGSDKKFAHIDSFIKNAGFKEYLDRDKIIARYKRKYPLNDWGISDHDLYTALKDKILNCHHREQPFFILGANDRNPFPARFAFTALPSEKRQYGNRRLLRGQNAAGIS